MTMMEEQSISTAETTMVRLVYPWSTGMPCVGNRYELIEAKCRDRQVKLKYSEAVLDLILSLAKFTSSMDVLRIPSTLESHFFHSFFGSDQCPRTQEEICSQLQSVAKKTHLSINFLADAAHILLRYRLLDIASEMLKVARQDWVARPQINCPKYSVRRLDKAFHALKNWVDILPNFHRIYQSQSTKIYTSQLFLEPDLNAKQQIFQAGLRTLHQACLSKISRDFHRVLFNVQIMVFCMWWLSAGFEDFPSDVNDLIAKLNQQAGELCVSKECLEDIAELGRLLEGDSTIASSMRNCYQLAVGISPLLLFVPRKLEVDGIRRDILIAHIVALGNERPERLRVTENAVWSLIFDMATGVSYQDCMNNLFDTVAFMESEDGDSDGFVENWFVKNRNVGTMELLDHRDGHQLLEQLTIHENHDEVQNEMHHVNSIIEQILLSNPILSNNAAKIAGASNDNEYLPQTVNPADLCINPYNTTQGMVPTTEPENLSTGTSNIFADEGQDQLMSSPLHRPEINISTMTETDGAQHTSGDSDTHGDERNSDDEPSSSDSDDNAGPGNVVQPPVKKLSTSSLSDVSSIAVIEENGQQMGNAKSEAQEETESVHEKRSRTRGKSHAKSQVLSEDSENDGGDESELSLTGNVPSPRKTRSMKPRKSPPKAKQSSNREKVTRNPEIPLPFFQNRRKLRVRKEIGNMSDVEKEGETKGKDEKATISFKLHGADHKVPATTWNFTSPSKTGKDYLSLVSSVVQSTKKHNRNNRPPHHLASARQAEYTSDASMFYVTTATEFNQLTAPQVQSIFRHRNIVVSGPAPTDFKFDHAGLSTLGSLTTPREIQVNSKRTPGGSKFEQLRKGTLKDLLKTDRKGGKPSLNVLDIPMGGAAIPTPIQYEHFASNEKAWQETRDFPAFVEMPFPSDIYIWGTAATRDTVTLVHEDDGGSGTSIKIMAGSKFWVVGRPKQDREPGSLGDMGSAFAFPAKLFDMEGSNTDLWDFEGVVLVAGDTLYMRPNTMHFVLTLSDSIAYGRHFYAASTIQDSVFGLVHTFMFGDIITNTRHDDLGTMFRRIMGMWYSHYEQESAFGESINPHVPDMSTEAGLMDIMALGNLIECAKVLDHRSYMKAGLHAGEQAEIAAARWWYRMLQIRFARRYVVMVGGKPITAFSVFRRSLVEFAAALVVYKSQPLPGKFITPNCTARSLQLKLKKTFESNFPELLPCLQRLVKEKVNTMYWTGPPIEIRLKTEEDKKSPAPPVDFDDRPIYGQPGSEVENSNDEDVEMKDAEMHDGSMKDLDDMEMESEVEDEKPKKSPRRLRSHQKGESNKMGRPLESDSAAEVPRKKMCIQE